MCGRAHVAIAVGVAVAVAIGGRTSTTLSIFATRYTGGVVVVVANADVPKLARARIGGGCDE
jgi:hypothetical protein